MRRKHPDLPRYTWDQAAMQLMFSSQSFQAFGHNPSTIRRWAKDGHLKPVGVGPNGNLLYLLADVEQAAKRDRAKSPGRPAKPHACSSTKMNAQ